MPEISTAQTLKFVDIHVSFSMKVLFRLLQTVKKSLQVDCLQSRTFLKTVSNLLLHR